MERASITSGPSVTSIGAWSCQFSKRCPGRSPYPKAAAGFRQAAFSFPAGFWADPNGLFAFHESRRRWSIRLHRRNAREASPWASQGRACGRDVAIAFRKAACPGDPVRRGDRPGDCFPRLRCRRARGGGHPALLPRPSPRRRERGGIGGGENNTSELQSLRHLVCRLLLEKKTSSIPV